MITPEDRTFLALKRITFRDMCALWSERVIKDAYPMPDKEAHAFFHSHGWTWLEYSDAYNSYYKVDRGTN